MLAENACLFKVSRHVYAFLYLTRFLHGNSPSGDSMHLNTGNRDALEFVSSALSYYVDYGPPG